MESLTHQIAHQFLLRKAGNRTAAIPVPRREQVEEILTPYFEGALRLTGHALTVHLLDWPVFMFIEAEEIKDLVVTKSTSGDLPVLRNRQEQDITWEAPEEVAFKAVKSFTKIEMAKDLLEAFRSEARDATLLHTRMQALVEDPRAFWLLCSIIAMDWKQTSHGEYFFQDIEEEIQSYVEGPVTVSFTPKVIRSEVKFHVSGSSVDFVNDMEMSLSPEADIDDKEIDDFLDYDPHNEPEYQPGWMTASQHLGGIQLRVKAEDPTWKFLVPWLELLVDKLMKQEPSFRDWSQEGSIQLSEDRYVQVVLKSPDGKILEILLNGGQGPTGMEVFWENQAKDLIRDIWKVNPITGLRHFLAWWGTKGEKE